MLGFLAVFLWKKDSLQWKLFLFFYTSLPALVCIAVFFICKNTWSLGNFSFAKFDLLYFVLYPFMCICYSFPLAFLTLQSGSIWPALFFHATNNAMGSISIQFVEKKKPKLEILLQMITGTVLLVPFAFLL